MRLLIDGYNLLYATDLFGEGRLAGTLEGSREALLRFLSDQLTERERRQTTIVFDAAGAPPGLPDTADVDGIAVRFARGYPDADTLLEEIIEAHKSPRGLMVVSSDHRVQRAARQRGASYIDSAPWHDAMRRRPATDDPADAPKRVDGAEDADYWIKQFHDPGLLDEVADQNRSLNARPAPPEPPRKPKRPPKQEFGAGIFDPFPPGYADDLARELNPPPEESDPLTPDGD